MNVLAYKHACKSKGVISFQFTSHSNVINGRFVQKEEVPLEIPNIPDDYWEYLNMFSVQKAKSLPDHKPYDLAI